jgi:hypothetical protein
MSRKRWLIAVVISLIALGAIAFYSASLVLSESVYSNRGTFAYWLTISNVIKGVPEIRPIQPPRFYSSAGDGPKLPESAVSYRSSADADVVFQRLTEYLTQQGYRGSGATFERENSIVSVDVTREGNETIISVRENQ